MSGAQNPQYRSVFVFDNDHPCVGPGAPQSLAAAPGIYRNSPATGIARVVCYSPRHNVTLAELESSEILSLWMAWREQYVELGARPEVRPAAASSRPGSRPLRISRHCRSAASRSAIAVPIPEDAPVTNATRRPWRSRTRGTVPATDVGECGTISPLGFAR